MSDGHPIRIVDYDPRTQTAKIQGPPVPKWMRELVRPYARGHVRGVMVMRDSVDIDHEVDGLLKTVKITANQWADLGGPEAMKAHGYWQPTHDEL